MTFKLSHVATAAAAAVIASSAVAGPTSPNVDPAQYLTGTTDIYLAGSSAVDLALTKFIANSCQASTLDTYRTDSGGKTYYLWTCETNNTAPNFVLPSGNTKIAIHKYTNSSSDGTKLVENGAAAAPYLQVADIQANCNASPNVVPATSTIPSYNTYACGNFVGTQSHAVRFGFSDAEPSQFDAANAAQLTSAYPLTIIFGIPVTVNVRNALQASQSLSVGDESEANMPSLTTSQINAIFLGRFSSWSQVGITLPGSDNSIYRVARGSGSGTTRAFDVTFIGDFCIPGTTSLPTLPALSTATLTTQCAVGVATKGLTAGTSDDVAACLNSFQSTSTGSANAGAIGYLSTDYQPQTGDGYRWIKIDGFAPKMLNVADGKWKDWSEESINFNKATPLTVGGVATDDQGFYNAIKATSASAALFSEIANNLPQATSGLWTGGVMGALPGAKNGAGFGLAAGTTVNLPRTDATMLALPANPATRATTSGYNLCNIPVIATGFKSQ